MATYQLLVRRGNGARFKDGDVVKVAEQGDEFGRLERAGHEVIEVDSADFCDIWNLDAELNADLATEFPSGAKKLSRKRLAITRLRTPTCIAPCRYRIDESGKVWDKKHD